MSAEVNEKRGLKAVNNPPTVNPTMVQRRIDAAKEAGARKREAADASREAMQIERQGRNSEQAYAAYVQETERRVASPPTARVQVKEQLPTAGALDAQPRTYPPRYHMSVYWRVCVTNSTYRRPWYVVAAAVAALHTLYTISGVWRLRG